MRPLYRYTVLPSLPQEMRDLLEIAYNLWWSWDHEAVDLFRRIDVDIWRGLNHNPVQLLATVGQDRLEELARDEGYLAQMERIAERLRTYLKEKTWYDRKGYENDRTCIAYFSAEFGVADCLPIYSGGLGILAGDHLKSASDLGLPLIGVGLLYQKGNFQQYLNMDGWQGEIYPMNDFLTMPASPVLGSDGITITVRIPLGDRDITAQIWQIQVGRVPLYMLDTNIPQNSQEDRHITAELYGGDLDMRIRQEIVLGIGGMRALRALGHTPTVCHMNEGHSAFLALERIAQLREDTEISFEEAVEATRSGNLFTTHTPVPAGIDKFPPALMKKYLGAYVQSLGIEWDALMAYGRQHPDDDKEDFSMAVLAIHLASATNGVSKLHGTVSRQMWNNVWPGVPSEEIPIDSVTNGIHFKSWISEEMANLYDRYLGPNWSRNGENTTVWDQVDRIPTEELWRTHDRRKSLLISFARQRLYTQLQARGAPTADLEHAREVLNSEALTIGFARRFATYKRSTLLLTDLERLKRILCNKDRPVQLIFAGRAHPMDNPGKEMIRQIVHLARDEELRNHIVFLENYDLNLARYMVQGVDVWLNNPRRPLEASGTSGMKATANGALNVSVLDGWWDEAFHQEVGWAIGLGEEYEDLAYQDEVESNALYDLLEKEIVPLYYDRGRDGLPRQWLEKMKNALKQLCPVFNTNRMVREYTERFYVPAISHTRSLAENNHARARELAHWKERIRKEWSHISVDQVIACESDHLHVSGTFEVRASLHLGTLTPDDVAVEIWNGQIDPNDEIVNAQAIPLAADKKHTNGNYYFSGNVPCNRSGHMGYALRILPKHPDMVSPYEMQLISWTAS